MFIYSESLLPLCKLEHSFLKYTVNNNHLLNVRKARNASYSSVENILYSSFLFIDLKAE
jgi:hypothetical protein